MSADLPLVAILGPTASGKSALGVWLAERLEGEVLACDSTQLYRDFEIGTARATPAVQRGITHHLVGLLEPEQVFTAGDYRRMALEALEELRARKKLPIFTVGTGLYLRALLEGLADAPTRSEELRERLRRVAAEHGPHYLHRLLGRLDRVAAHRIAVNDQPKLIRAIEVCLLAGRPLSAVHQAGRPGLPGYQPIKVALWPERRKLYQRIERRLDQMLEAGWPAEVRGLLERGVPPTAKPFQFIGYSELRAHLEGARELQETRSAIAQATRRYAKRQMTWFRREMNVQWFAGFGDNPEIASQVLRYVQENLPESMARSTKHTEEV